MCVMIRNTQYAILITSVAIRWCALKMIINMSIPHSLSPALPPPYCAETDGSIGNSIVSSLNFLVANAHAEPAAWICYDHTGYFSCTISLRN